MKALRFWIEIAKGLLGVWDDTVQEMGYTPFKASKKVTETKNKDAISNQFFDNKRSVAYGCV